MTYLLIAIPVISFLLDRLVKLWARTDLQALGGSLPLIEGVFHLTYVENRGAAFGMLQGQFWLFAILTPLVAAFLIYKMFFAKKKLPAMPNIAMALFLGGAIGNLYDRIFYGYVVDMFDFCLINFAVFNVADSCMVVGVLLYCVWVLFVEGKKQSRVKVAAEKGEDGRDL